MDAQEAILHVREADDNFARMICTTVINNTVDKHRETLIKVREFALAEDWAQVLALEEKVLSVNWMGETASTLLGTLANAHCVSGNWTRGIFYYEKQLAMEQEACKKGGGDIRILGAVYQNLGAMYNKIGNFEKAIEFHMLCLEIALQFTDKWAEGLVYAELGCSYELKGDFELAIQYNKKSLEFFIEDDDLEKQSMAYDNLGSCNMALEKYDEAVSFFHLQERVLVRAQAEHEGIIERARTLMNRKISSSGNMSLEDQVRSAKMEDIRKGLNIRPEKYMKRNHHMYTNMKLNMGIALTLKLRKARQKSATAGLESEFAGRELDAVGASDSDQEDLNSMYTQGVFFLESAGDQGHKIAGLHLAFIHFDAGQEEVALSFLKAHLKWLVGRGSRMCDGCGQIRSDDTHMLTCSGCKVARFCSVEHQKKSCKKPSCGGNIRMGQHNRICGLLGKWRMVVKQHATEESCTEDLLAYLKTWKKKAVW